MPAALNQIEPRFSATRQLRQMRQHGPAMGDLAFIQFGSWKLTVDHSVWWPGPV